MTRVMYSVFSNLLTSESFCYTIAQNRTIRYKWLQLPTSPLKLTNGLKGIKRSLSSSSLLPNTLNSIFINVKRKNVAFEVTASVTFSQNSLTHEMFDVKHYSVLCHKFWQAAMPPRTYLKDSGPNSRILSVITPDSHHPL